VVWREGGDGDGGGGLVWERKGKGRDLLMGGGGRWEGEKGRRDEVGVGDKEIGVQGERARRRMGSMRGLWACVTLGSWSHGVHFA